MNHFQYAQQTANPQQQMLQQPQKNQMTLQQTQQMQQMLQMQTYNQGNSFNQLNPAHFYNPMLMNQIFVKQMQSLELFMADQMAQQMAQQMTQSPMTINNKTSSRTIVMDESLVKQEEKMDQQSNLLPQSYCAGDMLASLDVSGISSELRFLLKYLAQEDCPKPSFINQHIKILPQINQQIVAIIMERYLSQRKTKEEQIKFVLRKCFKFLKSGLDVEGDIITPLDMEKRFYKVYFGGEEEMIPFRKNSNLKTMNSQYLRKIFLSPSFVEGFKDYLSHFDEIWDTENDEKIENMVKQVISLIQQNRIGKLQTFRRLPWVASIKNKCKNLALTMLKYAPRLDTDNKKSKILEDDSSIKAEELPQF